MIYPGERIVSPSISTIAQPGFLMGQKADERILNQIAHKEKTFKTLVLPTDNLNNRISRN